jgi:TolB-like protein/thioredoxin-like negative regulator of GroEL
MSEALPPTGKVFGHYHIQGQLGAGGMGVVYSAYDTVLQRKVAIKVVGDRVLVNKTARDLLLHEARAASSLNHPNICTIHEVGDSDGEAYIVMEQIEGQPLSSLLGTSGLSPGLVVRYGVQIADALAHAHEHGVIHRDLKSTNAVVTPEGRVKVLDFGLATRLGDAELHEANSSRAPLTDSRMIVGTLPFLAPELLRGEPAEARTDTWAIGVLLYEMASGTHPFCGRTAFELSSAILREAPTPLPSSVPSSLVAVIFRCLEKSPADRYQRSSDICEDLLRLEGSPDALRSGGWVEPIPAVPESDSDTQPRAARLGGLTAVSVPWWSKTQGRIAAVIIMALLILAAYFARQLFPRRVNPSGGDRVMLAVLPFLNFSGDPSQEYFNDGLTEEMITKLGSADPQRLGVIARTSAMKYKNTHEDVHQIGRELGVDYVLEGSVRREGDRVRISAQLIQVRDQTHLWAESYERDAHDTLALEIVVANTIADQVERTLSPPHLLARRTNARPVNPEAYDLYLKGRFYWNQRTEASFWKGIESFKQAIEKDPNFAQAYVGLADCYILLGPNDALPAKQVYPLAKAAVLNALRLDDALAEAHASLGFVTLLYDWNPAQAEIEFRRAIELDPSYATAHHWYAYDLAAMKRSDEAVAEIRRALELDPLSPIINTDVGQILFLARRNDEAIVQCQKTIALDPEFNQVYWYLGLLYEQKGMFDKAFDAFLKATPGPSDSPQGVAYRAAYRNSGIKGYWRQRLGMLERQSEKQYISPWTFAVSYSLMGDRDRALEKLEKAFGERYPSVIFVQIEPVFDNLRSDPRFAELLHRISSPP